MWTTVLLQMCVIKFVSVPMDLLHVNVRMDMCCPLGLKSVQGYSRPAVLLKASTGILGLVVDWIHELLYWVSTSTHALHVASLNGSKQSELIPGLSRPTAVAVQPLLG
ncbi:hypothetical protein cypCar_00039284 [Cyprinus carpio]|nr:hypothetical protein cypCar_00039284 [Cyprinus carpio]